jgi:hypothetical protein
VNGCRLKRVIYRYVAEGGRGVPERDLKTEVGRSKTLLISPRCLYIYVYPGVTILNHILIRRIKESFAVGERDRIASLPSYTRFAHISVYLPLYRADCGITCIIMGKGKRQRTSDADDGARAKPPPVATSASQARAGELARDVVVRLSTSLYMSLQTLCIYW